MIEGVLYRDGVEVDRRQPDRVVFDGDMMLGVWDAVEADEVDVLLGGALVFSHHDPRGLRQDVAYPVLDVATVRDAVRAKREFEAAADQYRSATEELWASLAARRGAELVVERDEHGDISEIRLEPTREQKLGEAMFGALAEIG